MTCHCCGEKCVIEVVVVKEITMCRDGIEMDVPVERVYCSEECRDEWE